jgi:hypothetical protein
MTADGILTGPWDKPHSTTNSLESAFRSIVPLVFTRLQSRVDFEMVDHICRVLADFSDSTELFSLAELQCMILASNPVSGKNSSFAGERKIHEYIGDYALYHAAFAPFDWDTYYPQLSELFTIGKSSYSVVASFNLFEFQEYAPLFDRLAKNFDLYVSGLMRVGDAIGDSFRAKNHALYRRIH